MDLEARKYHIIEQVMLLTESEVNQVEAALKSAVDPVEQEALMTRALESEQDIEEGKVFTIEEAESRLNQRFGI